jgi:hypothetical protein
LDQGKVEGKVGHGERAETHRSVRGNDRGVKFLARGQEGELHLHLPVLLGEAEVVHTERLGGAGLQVLVREHGFFFRGGAGGVCARLAALLVQNSRLGGRCRLSTCIDTFSQGVTRKNR